ncbi:MAG: hypothetical protein HYR84_12310 [Planctomycetes bacterium]|nr:hypothetical protein [Planctomycetota bacterium]
MPFIDIATQVGMEKGEALGMEIGIRAALVESILIDWEFKFGDEGKKYQTELDAIQDVEVLRKILRTGKTVSSLGELRKLWHADAE